MPKNVRDHYLWLFGFESSEGIPNVASDRVIRDLWNNLGGFIFPFLEKKTQLFEAPAGQLKIEGSNPGVG